MRTTRVRLAALPVEGVVLDDWTVSPLFVLDGATVTPRPPAMVGASGLADADIASFPAVWSAYRGRARVEAHRWLDRAAEAGTQVIVWVDGDQEIDLDHPAALLFEQGPDRSRRHHARIHAWPVLIHDFVEELYAGALAVRDKGPAPVVGFCGQATAGPTGRARLLAGKLRDRARHAVGRTDRIPAPLPSHLRLRLRALRLLETDRRITTDFVIRDQYRAGLRSRSERVDRTQASATEFFENIRRTDYTVCVRGGGNFSKRLYETLCLGRIPVIVDTDLVLPWADRVDWDDLAVIVPASGLADLPDRLVEHHGRLDPDGFIAAQHACRALWVERLSVPGFFGRFEDHLA